MARAHLRHSIHDEAGNAIQNAAVFVYQPGTTTAPSGTMHDAKTGGNVLTNPLITNSQGDIEAYFSAAQSVDLLVTDNSDGAYYPSDPARKLSWTDFTEQDEVLPAPEDIGGVGVTAHGSLTGLSGDVHPDHATEAAVTAEIAVHAGLADAHPDYATDDDLADHGAAADPHPGYVEDTDLVAHEGDADPHTGYQKESQKGAVNGYASLDAGGQVPVGQIPSSVSVAAHEAAADSHPLYRLEADEQVLIVGADQNLATADIVPENITALVATTLAEGSYVVDGILFVSASGAVPDIKLALDAPANADVVYLHAFGPKADETAPEMAAYNAVAGDATATQAVGVPASGVRAIPFSGVLMGADAGSLQLQASQATSDAATVTIKKGSFMRVRKA